MTVKELIEKLKEYEEEDYIEVCVDLKEMGYFKILDVKDDEVVWGYDEYKRVIMIKI